MLLKTENGKTVQVRDTRERRFTDAERAALREVLEPAKHHGKKFRLGERARMVQK